jgi:predicted outer membrane repeat protein
MKLLRIASVILAASLGSTAKAEPNVPYNILMQDVLINADYWTTQPEILSASLGFTQIMGIPDLSTSAEGQAANAAFGGAWEVLSTTNPDPDLRAYTSSATVQGIYNGFNTTVVGAGGFPVVFSWPVLPSTVDGSDFEVTLNTGERIIADGASISPNLEYNERSTVVLVSQRFGNRITPGSPGAVYPVRLTIVRDATPLTLVGPGGRKRLAVGLSHGDGTTPMTGYYAGPTLCAAKLSVLSSKGEGGPAVFSGNYTPNDGAALYGKTAKYRLRLLTTGGFSPDGVRSLYPTEFASFFQIEIKDLDGRRVRLTEPNKIYRLKAGSIRILGLADLSIAQSSYDDSYVEDHDNQIDIILQGDKAVMKRIKYVLVPSTGSHYKPFYNPGGPGNNPTPGVVYSKPTSFIKQAVTIAIKNPMTVSYGTRPND